MTTTGSLPAIRTGSIPRVGESHHTGEMKRPASTAAISFSALRKERKSRQQMVQLIFTGLAVFFLLSCLTGVTAYAAVSSALQEVSGGTPLPETYETAVIAPPSEGDAAEYSMAVEFSQSDYEERLLVPEETAPEPSEEKAPVQIPVFPTDEQGRFILTDSTLPEAYSVTVESEEGVYIYKTYTKTEEINYKTVYKDTSELPKGKEVVQTEGHSGSVTYTVRETYLDGVLKDKEIITRDEERSAQNRVILRGVGQAVSGSDGSSYSYKKQLSMKAYCYYAGENGGTHSATGKTLKYGMIAVDPRVIPLGTKVYIDAPGTAFDGVFVAEDTGGAIKGNIIDIYMESKSQAMSFGTQSVKVYILE